MSNMDELFLLKKKCCVTLDDTNIANGEHTQREENIVTVSEWMNQ